MRVGDSVRLNVEPGWLADLPAHLSALAAGRSVLDIGTAGSVSEYLPHNVEHWLHARLKRVATDLVGVDIDRAGIAYAATHGWKIECANCETMNLGRRFDLAVMVEVIEHVETPSRAIANTLEHLVPGGRLYITTPNPGYLGDVLRTLRGRAMSVQWDHQAMFAPEHLQSMCDRHGFALTEVKLFTHYDWRNPRYRFKSGLAARIGRINPRLNTSWLGVIEAR